MQSLRIGLATQTPLLRLAPGEPTVALGGHGLVPATSSIASAPVSTPVATLIERGSGPEEQTVGRLADHHITPGGVSRMVLQSVQAWQRSGWLRDATWFSLQPNGPRRIRLEDVNIDVQHLRLPPEGLKAYARTKEMLWADIHGLPSTRFEPEDFRFYARYNGSTSDAFLQRLPDLDLAYVHDFQLLQVGAIVGLAAPTVLRWHVPFEPRRIPGPTRHFLLRMMEAFDGVIVSTRRDLQGLSNAGFHGKVRQIYPHSDGVRTHAVPTTARDQYEARIGLKPDDQILLCVARMDPMKRQDLLLQAFAKVQRQHPRAKVVFVGNGSFSGSSKGGLGLSKADLWRKSLETLTHELGLADRVTFTGWMPDTLVAAAYGSADAVILPSDIEGFGLTVFEAWAHGKPCLVSDGCGAAEVVQHGVTGLRFPSGDAEALADGLHRVLRDREGALRMGEAGRIALDAHTPERAAQAEASFLEESIAAFRGEAAT